MKTALTVWKDRISPVFDVAERIVIYEINEGNAYREIELDVSGYSAFEKVTELAKLNTGVIICGAVSRPVSCLADAYGIDLYSFITGDADSVVKAFSEGLIMDDNFRMPGCSSGCWKNKKCYKQAP
jgi:predicted Fe-Mo cluster-binding NifX family protein